jgi:AraC-like DNA-binding protein
LSFKYSINKLFIDKYARRNLHEEGIPIHFAKDSGRPPKLRIIDFFLDNPLFDFTKKEVIEALGMSKQTFYKYFEDIEKYGIVKVSRKMGRAKLYRINLEHPLVSMLREYETKVSMQIAEEEARKINVPAKISSTYIGN